MPLLFFLTIVTLSSNPDYSEISILMKYGPDMTSVVEKILNFRQPGKKLQWKEVSTEYMRQGLQAKFTQNYSLRSFLKSKNMGNMLLIEANPFDRFWGVGIGLNDSDIWIESRWKGENRLGKLLMELRESF